MVPQLQPRALAAGDGRSARHLDVGAALRLALGVLFVGGAALFGSLHGAAPDAMLMAAAAGFGAYMALNIGANDVANNVGPAVGADVLNLGSALLIAAVFEAAGALIAGGEVVRTIRSEIIVPGQVPDGGTLVWLMMAALLGAALWLHIASAMGAPVATTHAIVGAVLGAGVAAGGRDAVEWSSLGSIAVGWLVSPVLGSVIAAVLLYLMKRSITYRCDRVRAACTHLPWLVAMMAWAFSTYLLSKGLSHVWSIDFSTAAQIGLVLAAVVYFGTRRAIARGAMTLDNSKHSINRLFALPLVFAVAMLSFAHGANDVANAIGPVAAIFDLVSRGAGTPDEAVVPLWVLGIGALGISLGLALYGPRVIHTVSTGITALDPMRAYAIAMATALTVIVASQIGLPVSTTHVAVGAILGVGLLRESLKRRYQRMVEDIREHHLPADTAAHDAFLERFAAAAVGDRGRMLAKLKQDFNDRPGRDRQASVVRKRPRVVGRQKLVQRSMMVRIVVAWMVTVPASAAFAAALFLVLRGLLLP